MKKYVDKFETIIGIAKRLKLLADSFPKCIKGH